MCFLVSVWPRTSGQCLSDPPSVPNAFTNISGQEPPFPDGTVARYMCDRTYSISGPSRFTTCTNSRWMNSSFECTPISCPFIATPRYSRVVGNPEYIPGTYIAFVCNTGFEMIGQSVLTCRTDGSWNMAPPVCRAKSCGEFPPIPNAQIFQPTSTFGTDRYDSFVRVTCNSGYFIHGNPLVYCEETGNWGARPTCDTIACPRHPGLSSSCVDNSLDLGTTLYIICLDNDNTSVTDTAPDVSAVTCETDSWSDISKACYCDCKIPEIPNITFGNLNVKHYLPHSETLQWQCPDGFVRHEGFSLHCNDNRLVTERDRDLPVDLIINNENAFFNTLCLSTATVRPTERTTQSTTTTDFTSDITGITTQIRRLRTTVKPKFNVKGSVRKNSATKATFGALNVLMLALIMTTRLEH